MKKTHTQFVYAIFAVIITGLVLLIGWFIYLLVKPTSSTPTPVVNSNSVTNKVANANTTNKTNKSNTNQVNQNKNTTTNANQNTNAANSNANANTNVNVSNTNSSTNTNTTSAPVTEPTTITTTAPTDNGDDTTTITLYFPKTGGACGEVSPVRRTIATPEDLYGQIIIEAIHGPSSTDVGYTSAMPSGLRLRQVEYQRAAGSIITVNEAYDTLNDCNRKTADAQLIQTANAMFEVDIAAAGEVVVGEVATNDTNTNTNE